MCGCKDTPADVLTKAARCHLCLYSEHLPDAVNQGATLCYDGVPIVGRSVCPRGYFDSTGIVRWMGIRWYGLPIFMRVFLYLFKRSHPKISSWNSCGCVVVIKDFWTKFR